MIKIFEFQLNDKILLINRLVIMDAYLRKVFFLFTFKAMPYDDLKTIFFPPSIGRFFFIVTSNKIICNLYITLHYLWIRIKFKDRSIKNCKMLYTIYDIVERKKCNSNSTMEWINSSLTKNLV